MWLKYANTGNLVGSIEEGVEKLLKVKEKYSDAYLEVEGKRLYALDISASYTLEECMEKMRDITPEEYIADIEETIELNDGDYSGFDIAEVISYIPNNSTRIPVMKHFVEKVLGIPAFTDRIAREATLEERKDLLEFYKENGILIDRKIFYPKIWIVPNNDLEAKTIIEILKDWGEKYLVTGQTWGASWEGLEPEIKAEIEEAKKAEKKIYGVELQGNAEGVINIDHHTYGEDDRSNAQSSLEQVVDILGIELTVDQEFVSANDKGFIPAMEKLGKEFGISKNKLQEIISNIRRRDRLAQGVTINQEAQAQEAVEKLGEIKEKQKYILVDKLPHSKTSTITDRLYGKYENLLITSTDGETNFYGSTEIIKMLNEKFPGGWSGGQLEQGSGFWGRCADQEEIKKVVEELILKEANKLKDDKENNEFLN